MRVISGAARGHKLFAPAGDSTRPTADSVKESLFNIIGNEVAGRAFLDLFAGSGAVGIEALSRGAASAVFVDSARASVDAIQRNLEKTRLTDKARIYLCDAAKSIPKIAGNNVRFDYIFLDPPYGREEGFLLEILNLLNCYVLLNNGGICILERQSKEPPLQLVNTGFCQTKERVYGNAKLTFLVSSEV